MRVYTKVVINIKTLEEIEEVHKTYEGPVAMCGGGGGQSGKVELPDAIKNYFVHMVYDGRENIDRTQGMPADMATAFDNNPFADVASLDPSGELSAIDTEVGLYNTLIGSLSETTDWAALMTQAITSVDTAFATVTPDSALDITNGWLDPSDGTATTGITSNWLDPSPNAPSDIFDAWIGPVLSGASDIGSAWIDPTLNAATDIAGAWIDPAPAAEEEIAADVDAYGAIVDEHVESDILPRFQRGMQNINAVMSSAFVIGEAIIEKAANRDIAKYQGQLRVAAFVQADEIKSRSKLGESSRLADAHIQDDALAAQGNTAESNRLADAHIQDDALAAQDNITRNSRLADANMQDDVLSAQSKLGESNRIADAEIQDIVNEGQGKLGESNRLADAYIQVDQIETAQAEQKNKMYMLSVSQMLQYFTRRVDGELQVSQLIMEANRLRIIAEKEEKEEQMILDESGGLWSFVIWQHAANMLAAPSGAAMVPGKGMTRGQSALTGAAAGASAGGQAGGGYGAIIGAVVGAGMGYYA